MEEVGQQRKKKGVQKGEGKESKKKGGKKAGRGGRGGRGGKNKGGKIPT